VVPIRTKVNRFAEAQRRQMAHRAGRRRRQSVRAVVPRVACAVGVLALVACRESGGPEEELEFSYAIFNADVTSAQSGGLATSPVGFFFRAPLLNLPTSQGETEGCVLQRLVSPGSALPLFIGAGDSVAFAAQGGSTVYLKPQTDSGITSYRVPGRTPVPLSAGATVTFTVPGTASGFPASSIALKTVEPYQMSPVPNELPAGQSLTLTWSPPGDAPTDTRMEVAFMYATAAGGALNEQLYCSLIDDGEFTIQSGSLSGFRAAAGGVRQVLSRRWRSSFKDLGDSVMLAISSYLAPSQVWP
jgi:hypothetical protein